MKKELGGKRLGSGAKMEVDLKTYNRSTHDLSYVWRNTMSAGTLVPFMTEVALPGDTMDIDLNISAMTHPTVGPLFGSYKVQADVFVVPIRLYIASLNNNTLGVGLNMSKIKLPQLLLNGKQLDFEKSLDNQQINSSSIWSYLNIRGIGRQNDTMPDPIAPVRRMFNGIPFIAYWDIYKNYYSNKQEEIGAVVHLGADNTMGIINGSVKGENTSGIVTIAREGATETPITYTVGSGELELEVFNEIYEATECILIDDRGGRWNVEEVFESITINRFSKKIFANTSRLAITIVNYNQLTDKDIKNFPPKVKTFPLTNIDDMRKVLQRADDEDAVIVNLQNIEPYTQSTVWNAGFYPQLASQEGLALKTYQSDLFNNWLNKEWIEGENGINAITAIDTSDGSFTLDTLNLTKKVYDMLNRIAVSGGTYDDWISTVYTHDSIKNVVTPVYMGGLSKELIFQEVVSNSASEDQPLGTLAGRGTLGSKNKGGKVIIRCDEPSYVIGIVSLTPRLDYSQGNKWDVNLKTMDDFHKPALDEIGFQDLITDAMAYHDTICGDQANEVEFKSAGKQPAWINYMTNVNQVRGNFAEVDNEMFMTLNRRYEHNEDGSIKDLTTYIDPMKFNHIFAETSRDAMNFWMQIGVNITARRKMSAKLMPNI